MANPLFIKRAIEGKAANCLLLKVNQIGSISESIAAVELSKQNGWASCALTDLARPVRQFTSSLLGSICCALLSLSMLTASGLRALRGHHHRGRGGGSGHWPDQDRSHAVASARQNTTSCYASRRSSVARRSTRVLGFRKTNWMGS